MSLKTNPTLQAETDGHVFAEADDRTLPRQRFAHDASARECQKNFDNLESYFIFSKMSLKCGIKLQGQFWILFAHKRGGAENWVAR